MLDITDIPYPIRAGLRTGTRPTTPEGSGDTHWNPTTAILSLANPAGTAWVEYVLSTSPTATLLGDLGNVGTAATAKGGLLIPDGTDWQTLAVAANGKTIVTDSSQSLGWAYKDYKMIGLEDWAGSPVNGDVPMYNSGTGKWEPSIAVTAATTGIGVSFYTPRNTFYIANNVSSISPSFSAGHIKLDTSTFWSVANPTRFTMPSAGKYAISLNVMFYADVSEVVASSDPRIFVQNQIGTTLGVAYMDDLANGYGKSANLNCIATFSASNYITITLVRPSGYAAYATVNGTIQRIGS